jgi:hypothetical protein
MNPLSRLLAGLLAVLALAGALFFGVFVLALVLGLGLVAWVFLWVRMWWIRRKMPRSHNAGAAADSQSRQSEIIDAEYTVVSRRDED